MKPEDKIDQKQLLKLIKVLNDQFKAKIKTKGSITDLAEAFAKGVEDLSDKALPDEVIDFFNDLFMDEASGYKDVDTAKTEVEPPPEELEETTEEPLPDEEPPPEEDGVEELPELEAEEELPGEEEEPLPEPDDELEELDEEEPPPPKRGRGRPATKKPEPKPTVKKPLEKKISSPVRSNPNKPQSQKKEEPTMLEKLQSIVNKPELKAFVKEYNINIKLKNNESLQVWKAKVKKLIEGICTPTPTEKELADLSDAGKRGAKAGEALKQKLKVGPNVAAKIAKKPPQKAKAETKPEKKVVAKAKAEKTAKAPKKPRGEKDAFGVTIGSLTHSFVQAIGKKSQTMKMLVDSGIGKHPKALKKFIAMGYMERDKAGIISMTVKGRKVYGWW